MPPLKSSLLTEAGFPHGFSTREHDLSLTAVGYAATLDAFAKSVGLDAASLRQTRQVHGCVVVDADLPPPSAMPEADALVATGRAAIGVRTADCVPILVADPVKGMRAAIHAGWRGYVAGVVEAAVAALRARGAERLIAAVGPAIGPCCFEVGLDVALQIEKRAGVRLSVPGDPEKALVDLRGGVLRELRAVGVAEVERIEGCTRCDAQRFFSYRRGAEVGRMLAAIGPRSSAA